MCNTSINGVSDPCLSFIGNSDNRLITIGNRDMQQQLGNITSTKNLMNGCKPSSPLFRAKIRCKDTTGGTFPSDTTRKSINTNRNIKGIFSLVNFQGILPTEIFPRYILRKLQWEKNLKQRKKNDNVSFFTNEITDRIIPPVKSVGKSVGIFQRAPELFTFQLHC